MTTGSTKADQFRAADDFGDKGASEDLTVSAEAQKLLALIHEARSLIAYISHRTRVPAVYQAVHIADTNLHWAAWQLGEVAEIMPELETFTAHDGVDQAKQAADGGSP
ncbi:MAG: hypothetical protein M1115_11900 [Actinobacteria bacterium]|nr:hypothetical protein [Actinomycetota bacterium]